MQRIDFFIAGVQKSGTTALDSFLRGHPSVQMASIKEVHFFDNEAVNWDAPAYGLLNDKFDWSSPDVLRGEATPIYTYWPNALHRLQRYNVYAKIIVGLRHPSMRAYSHWRMEMSRNADTLDFGAAIRSGRDRVEYASGGVHRVFSYVERGFYDAQVRKLLSLFPREQLHFFRTDRLFDELHGTLAAIEDFLEVERKLAPTQRYVVPLESSEVAELSSEDRIYLDHLFAPSIEATQSLTGLDLADWLSPHYTEPMNASAQ